MHKCNNVIACSGPRQKGRHRKLQFGDLEITAKKYYEFT